MAESQYRKSRAKVDITNHCTASNLILLKRLFDFLKHSEVTNITPYSLTCRTKRTQSIGDVNVDFSRICLSRDGECGFEACFMCDEFVEFLNLGMVSVEDFFSLRCPISRRPAVKWSYLDIGAHLRKNDACVPVVPLTPRNRRSFLALSKLRRSIKRS